MNFLQILNAMVLAFFINVPIQIIITIGQWLVMARFIAPSDRTIKHALSCLAATYITAWFIALLLWLFWPLDPDLILYKNRISIPAVIGEAIAMLYWMKHYKHIFRKKIELRSRPTPKT